MDNETPRFRKEFKLWKACEKKGNSARDCLEYVCFDNGFAYASDGHILAKIDLKTLTTFDDDEIGCLNGHCIHADVYRLLTHYDNIHIGTTDDGNLTLVVEVYKNTLTFGLAKKEKIAPPIFESVLKAEGEHKPIEKIGIEKTFLNNLTDAIGQSRVKMDFYSESSKIIVTPINADYMGVTGLIMPIMTTGTLDLD